MSDLRSRFCVRILTACFTSWFTLTTGTRITEYATAVFADLFFCRHERDLVLFHNRGVLHSVVGAFKPDQVRAFHQCNLAASGDPAGPDADDVKKWV